MKSESLARSGGCALCVGQQHCLLGRQNDQRRADWAPLVVERPMSKGELLLRQGELQPTFRIVKTGTVMLMCSGEDRVERPIGLFGSGQPLGTTGVLEQPAAVSCRALTAGRVCEVAIASASRQGLLDETFVRSLAQSYAQTNAWLAEWARIVRIRGVAGQLAATLLQLARIQRSTLVRLPSHVVLADLLSTTRETIARALRQLTLRQGLIRHDRWHCEIQREVLLGLAGGQKTPSASHTNA